MTFPSAAQTTGDPADLATNRQILPDESATYQAAYAALAHGAYPWSLPFDRAAEEAMAHLDLLGVPPPKLMQTLSAGAARRPPRLAYEIAAVSLGLCPLDRAIVTGARRLGDGRPSPASYWNLASPAAWEHEAPRGRHVPHRVGPRLRGPARAARRDAARPLPRGRGLPPDDRGERIRPAPTAT